MFHDFRVSKKPMSIRGKITVSIKKCSLTAPKNFVGEPFCDSQNFWCRKNLWIRRRRTEEVSPKSVKLFLSHSTEKLRRSTFLFYTNFLVSKYSMDKRWGVKAGGVSRYSSKNFLSQSTEKFRRGNFLFLKKFWYRKTS